MKIRYRDSALEDLRQIAEYFGSYSQATLFRAHKDIDDYIKLLMDNPKLGRKLDDGSRLIVSAKYRFNITYELSAEIISIVGIYRFQNR